MLDQTTLLDASRTAAEPLDLIGQGAWLFVGSFLALASTAARSPG